MPEINKQPYQLSTSKENPIKTYALLLKLSAEFKTKKVQHLLYTQTERELIINSLVEIIQKNPENVFETVENVISHAIEDWVLESNSFNTKHNITSRHYFNLEKQQNPNQFTLTTIINGLLKNEGSEYRTKFGLTNYNDLLYICNATGLMEMINQSIVNYDQNNLDPDEPDVQWDS